MDNYFENTEWKLQRLGKFTASEIHKLFVSGRKKDEFFGQGARTYIRTKAAELLTMEVKEEIEFKQAEWGKLHEFDAYQTFEERTGLKGEYYGAGNPTFFPYGEFAGSSPDWEGENEGADFKCPYNSAVHVENLILNSETFKDARWEYYCQLQMSMHNREWERAHFVSYDPRMVEFKYRLKVITIYPDSEWVEEYLTRLERATEELNRILEDLEKPSVLLAQRDTEINATIIQSI